MAYHEIGQIADALARFWPLYVAIVAAAAIVRGSLKWFKKMIAQQLEPLVLELSPNGGGSMKDQLKRVDEATKQTVETQKVIGERVDLTYGMVSGADARVQAIRASTAQPYVEMDQNLQHTFVNQAYTDLFGIEYVEGSGDMDWESKVHHDDVYRLSQLAERLRENPQSYQVESRIIRRDLNEVLHVVSYGYPMTNPDGTLAGYAATVEVRSREPLPEGAEDYR